MKGSGLANTCPVIDAPGTDGKVKAGAYKVEKMCLEPTSFTVKEDSQFKGGESEFVKTKLMTRLTYSLDAISGEMKVGNDGSVDFLEKDGIDYAAVTVQLPGGERVPFLFSLKNFEAKGNLSAFGGEFNVPSYRGSSFLDPKVRDEIPCLDLRPTPRAARPASARIWRTVLRVLDLAYSNLRSAAA